MFDIFGAKGADILIRSKSLLMVIHTSSSQLLNTMTLFRILKLISSQRLILNLLLPENATSLFSRNQENNMLRVGSKNNISSL